MVKGFFAFLLFPFLLHAGEPHSLMSEPLVNLKTVDPSIVIDLRYASPRNVTGQPLYPANAPCLIRASVAQWLRYTQYILRKQGYGLKIWDAYRPPTAQQRLFDFIRKPEFIANPAKGALHTWGVAVDATLVDLKGHDVPMPTDFDIFTTTAAMHYHGEDTTIAKNLKILQRAMSPGFYGLRGEWWHFMVKNWAEYGPILVVPPEFTPKSI